MRIIIDARNIGQPTGRYTISLLDQLQKIDTQNTYIVLMRKHDKSAWSPSVANFTIQFVEYKEYSFAEQIGFARFLKSLKPDLVHFTMFNRPLPYRGLSISTVHDLTPLDHAINDPRASFLQRLYRYQIKRRVLKASIKHMIAASQTILTPTQYVANDIRKRWKSIQNIVVTLEAGSLDGSKLEPLPDLNKKNFILYVGAVSPHKNIDALIRAHLTVHKKTGTHLVIAGKTSVHADALKRLITEQGSTPYVHWTGYVNDAQLAWLYQNCKATIVPSLSEGFGLPGLEALRQGSVLVSSDATCLPEVYGNAAIYFDPRNDDDMSEKIITAVSDAALRQKLQQAGPRHAKKFSWQKMAQQTHAEYMSLLHDKKS